MSRRIKHIVFLMILLLNCSKNISFAQTIFYQDICNCGVTGSGFSLGVDYTASMGLITLQIPSGSYIRKALLFSNRYYNPPPTTITLNNQSYTFDYDNQIGQNYYIPNAVSNDTNNCAIHMIDVTSSISSAQQSYTLEIPNQQSNENPNAKYSAFYLLVIYENISLPKMDVSIIINNQNQHGDVLYSIAGLNPINSQNPVGLAINSDIIWDTITDGTYININSNLLGLIGGSDAINNQHTGAGVKGCFYYQANQLYGLDDDTPDSIMGGTDGLADISHYINNNSTSLNIMMNNQKASTKYNIYLQYFLTHTTPCEPILSTTSNDTTICKGQKIELAASGGQNYKWNSLSSENTDALSCFTCANPTFDGNKTQIFTVEISDNNGCSVIKPIKITVVPEPKTPQLIITNDKCSHQYSGRIQFQTTPDMESYYLVSENGDTIININPIFNNLKSGNYQVFYINKSGCNSEVVIASVGMDNDIIANFEVIPNSGAAPLSVVVENTSENATNYDWSLNGEIINNIPSIFDTSGAYVIQLVAWNNIPECSDTITKTVLVYDSLILEIPNVFTPNKDGINDNFTVKVEGAKELKWSILNRWGEIIYESQKEITEHKTSIILWNGKSDGNEILKGTYFYLIEAKDEQNETKKLNGFFHLTR